MKWNRISPEEWEAAGELEERFPVAVGGVARTLFTALTPETLAPVSRERIEKPLYLSTPQDNLASNSSKGSGRRLGTRHVD
jgi:hypothetical protein